ncbi:MAG TPA: PHP domain-containing protein [Pirellulales bacterium]
MSNAQIAEFLRRYAAVLVLEGADRFKIKAYRRAAETLETLKQDVTKFVSRGEDLKQLPAIGPGISATIEQIVRTGGLPQLERALGKLEPGLLELATKPALDPTKIKRIYKKLGIGSLRELKERLDSGEIREVLGARLEFHIRQGLHERPRMLLWAAEKLIPAIQEQLSQCGATQVAAIGSLRRKKDTVGDLGFLISGRSASTIFKRFARFAIPHPEPSKSKHEKRFQLSEGRTINLVWSKSEEWGLSLLHHTGSDSHLAALVSLAKKQRDPITAKALGRKASDEGAVYARLGLQFIEPELREDRGEVEAAAVNALPTLVSLQDIRGDLHMHTTESDGADTLLAMAEAAQQRGYEYIAITDHSQSLKITNGLTEKRLFQQIKAIDKLNAKLKGLTVLKSGEVDILEDGKLDYSDAILKELDLTICSIHSRFALNREQQTNRLLRAMDNPYFNILGHATGRLLLKREGYELDFDKLMQHARSRDCFFEINSSPDRLDLSAERARMAKEQGIKIAINTDAHSTRELCFISAGINQARRGWLGAKDVLNTHSLAALRKLLRK